MSPAPFIQALSSDMLLHGAHCRLLRGGEQGTLTRIRERNWILRGRQPVQMILRSCLECRRLRLLPQVPSISQLPRERICETSTFNFIAADSGLLSTSGSCHLKAYIAVFFNMGSLGLYISRPSPACQPPSSF